MQVENNLENQENPQHGLILGRFLLCLLQHQSAILKKTEEKSLES